MTDEAFVLKQTNQERKRVGRGAFAKKGGSKSKKCSLPTDYMTRKEILKMNGEIETYKLNVPRKWEEYKQLPTDIRKAYLENLFGKYCGTETAVAKMFGVSRKTLRIERGKLGIENAGRNGKPTEAEYATWRAFLGEEAGMPSILNAGTLTPVVIPDDIRSTDPDIFEILKMLKGTGAKLTIEVTL